MKNSKILDMYLNLFNEVSRNTVEKTLTTQLTEAYEKNTLGFRLITTLIHQYFIKGGEQNKDEHKKVTFNKKLKL